MFDQIFHADWSLHSPGRWVARAWRTDAGWRVEPPRPVGDLPRFRADLLAAAAGGTVLAGFDFPIGVPIRHGVQTGFAGFREALPAFGTAAGWQDFYVIAPEPDAITVARPFYPAGSGAGTRLATLVARLGLGSAQDLLRACERGCAGRKRASPLFWTVGAAQVGRAAGVGWREVIVPLLRAGAALWPFDGSLAELATRPGLVLAETYPADAYAAVDAPFRGGESKRRQGDRKAKAAGLLAWAGRHQVDVSGCAEILLDGFGPEKSGEDPFDALLGLLAAIPIADAPGLAMRDGPRPPAAQINWEGWILGR